MSAPGLTFTVTGSRVSGVAGYDHITVSFQADQAYAAFQCRATKEDEDYGVEMGPTVFPCLPKEKTEAGTTTTCFSPLVQMG